MKIEERINEFLDQFGHNLKGDPIFRICWSTDQKENRYGTYNEFHGKIFLRTISEVKEVPKYPYTPDRWIIERWAPPELAHRFELPDSKEGSYESIYIFEGPNREYLEPVLLVVQMVMYTIMNPREKGQIIASAREEAERMDKELEKNIEDMFAENYPLADKMHGGEATFIKSKEN